MLQVAMYFVCKHCNTGSCARACVCVCVPRTPHGGLSDTSVLEIRSGGGSGLNSLPVRTGSGVRTLRSAAIRYFKTLCCE